MIILGYIVVCVGLACFWGVAVILSSRKQCVRLAARLAMVGISCAYIAYYLFTTP